MNDELYSWCEEKLEDHLIETFRIYKLNFEDRVVKILEGRLNHVFDDFSKLILRLTFLLHDIGKSHPTYQKTIKFRTGCLKGDCNKCNDKPRFSWHEVLSTYLYLKLIEELLFRYEYTLNDELKKVNKNLQTISAASILVHHQAIREPFAEEPQISISLGDWKVKEIFSLLLKLVNLGCEKLKVDTSILKESVDDVLDMLNKDFAVGRYNLTRLSERVCRLLHENFQKNLWKPKIYSIVAGSLVICDWLAAKKLRKTTFAHSMLDEIRYAFKTIKFS